jgi:hypothetical protein
MAQTLEGIPTTGRPLGWRAAARLGGSAAPAMSPEVRMPAARLGEAAAS